jgi:hypothetical protein
VVPLQLAKQSSVEIVRSGWGNGRFSNRRVKADALETASWSSP